MVRLVVIVRNRGYIKWHSFDSLYKLSSSKNEISNNKNRYSMPILSTDQQEELEQALYNAYARGNVVTLLYYHNYKYYKIVDKIIFIDKINKKIKLSKGKVLFLRQIIRINEI